MYNIDQLKAEKASCKRKIITLSILTGVMVFIAILSVIFYVVSTVIIAMLDYPAETLATLLIADYVIFLIVFISCCIAVCVFTPFIVINGIKNGKRRRLIASLENDENGVING